MNGNMVGADLDDLRQLAEVMGAAARRLEQARGELTSGIQSVQWDGLDASGAIASWSGQSRAIDAAVQLLVTTSADVRRHHDEQAEASGVQGLAGPNGPVVCVDTGPGAGGFDWGAFLTSNDMMFGYASTLDKLKDVSRTAQHLDLAWWAQQLRNQGLAGASGAWAWAKHPFTVLDRVPILGTIIGVTEIGVTGMETGWDWSNEYLVTTTAKNAYVAGATAVAGPLGGLAAEGGWAIGSLITHFTPLDENWVDGLHDFQFRNVPTVPEWTAEDYRNASPAELAEYRALSEQARAETEAVAERAANPVFFVVDSVRMVANSDLPAPLKMAIVGVGAPLLDWLE